MNTNDSTIPELMQNAEFLTIRFPLSRKERCKRALLAGGLAASVTFFSLSIAAILSETVRARLTTWN